MKIGIVGTGPAALMAGSQYLLQGFEVSFYEHKKAPARKFLVAGHGGFNLTHSEPKSDFLARYDCEEIRKCVSEFDSEALISWLNLIGIETYIGSTGKIFPIKGIKPIDVLNAWLTWLKNNGADFHFEHKMLDFDSNSLLFHTNSIEKTISFDKIVFALGGGSWSKTGSDGAWIELFKSKNIDIVPLQTSNAGMNFRFHLPLEKMEGEILKNVVTSIGDFQKAGEVTLTKYGFEGAAIYHLNRAYRENPNLPLSIDLKPQWNVAHVLDCLKSTKNNTEGLKKMKLSKAAIFLLKSETEKEIFLNPESLAQKIKNLSLKIESLRPIDEAISTSGGVSWTELENDLSLKKFPNIKLCGEMLDWDAPTGGYLLQASIASGFCVGSTRESNSNK
jgi:uncharacterized flavoprotein (TIGR03862 family)